MSNARKIAKVINHGRKKNKKKRSKKKIKEMRSTLLLENKLEEEDELWGRRSLSRRLI
jgi:hypothetical protein